MMIQLSGINIYPIKSLGGIRLQNAKIGKKGLFLDRRWMLVDPAGHFLTQRNDPSMALIGLEWTAGGQHLQIFDKKNKQQSISLSIKPSENTTSISVQIWNDLCKAVTVGQIYDDWFTQALGRPCKLVYLPDASKRPVSTKYAKPSDEVSFADGFPYLICNEASLSDLNQRLAEEVSMDRFRPNLIFSGGKAWEEDQWKSFQIGNVPFRSLKPCARCTLLTVNPITSEKGIEPLQTLSTFRKVENKVLFGTNACWDNSTANGAELNISVGDQILPVL
jgi:hypothetical protein